MCHWRSVPSWSLCLSTLVKPVTLLVLGLTGASLLWILWTERGSLRTRSSLAAIVISIMLVAAAAVADKRAASPGAKAFAASILFCQHIPLVLPVIGQGTPERAELSGALRGLLALGPRYGWNVLGYEPNDCLWRDPVQKDIRRVLEAEHAERADWLMHQFLLGVRAQPLAFLRTVERQLHAYFQKPVAEITVENPGAMADWEWLRISPYARFLGMTREALVQGVAVNPVARDYPSFIRPGKWFLSSFAPWSRDAVLLVVPS